MYIRLLQKQISARFNKGKAIILIGPRQSGKTTLFNNILKNINHLYLDADNPTVRGLLTNPNFEQLKNIISNNKFIFLDEAQRIPNIGISLKMIIDQIKDVQLLISGSSSFDLGKSLNEPLTGRKWEYTLLPISWEEFENKHGLLISEQQLELRLLHGFYPDVLNNPGMERDILSNLTNSYLFKDIFSYGNTRKPEIIEKLTEALAFQIGNEVNYSELSQIVGVDKKTISNYIDLLEKAFIIFRLRSYSGNLRNEIKRNRKIYFFDNGIRNMIINDFTPFDQRGDKGALWENFIISERFKYNLYHNTFKKMYFWRTKQQQEIDLLEIKDGKIEAFEIKYSENKNYRISKSFTNNYMAETHLINKLNFRDFIS